MCGGVGGDALMRTGRWTRASCLGVGGTKRQKIMQISVFCLPGEPTFSAKMIEGESPGAPKVAYKIHDTECFPPCHVCQAPALVKLTNNLFASFFSLLIFFYASKDVESTPFKDGRHFIILIDAIYSQLWSHYSNQ